MSYVMVWLLIVKYFAAQKKNMEVLDETNMNKSFCNIVNIYIKKKFIKIFEEYI
jgi:hypothetical protein